MKQAESQRQLELDKTKKQLIDEKSKINEFKSSLQAQVEALRSEVDRKAQKYEHSKLKMQTEVEVLKEENAKLRRGMNTKTRNAQEIFF